MEYAIEAEGLVKRFGTTLALDGVDLAVARAPSSACSARTAPARPPPSASSPPCSSPTPGSARSPASTSPRDAAEVRRAIGLTGQYASVDEDLTGTQNLVMIGRLLDLTRRDAQARAAELLEWFDLTDAADRPAKTYSGGMRRRLDLAASLVGRPVVIFLDEPTTGLDPSKREDMWGSSAALVARRLDRAAHHPVPRRGRRAGRRDHRHRPRPGHRPRHP